MGQVKSFLIWTNPLTYVFGLPVLTGFILASMFDGVFEKTSRIAKSIEL